MNKNFSKHQIALATLAVIGATALVSAPTAASAADKSTGKTPGKYVAGDFHNHTTCSDGAISMQKLVQKSTGKTADAPWGLDWFVQAGHGGSGNRNCTLAEDESLATPAYPLVYSTGGVLLGPTTTWQNSNPAVTPKGVPQGAAPNQGMWRWQALQEFQYPLLEYLAAQKDKPLFLGIESVVAGHEHTSMSVITGQMPAGLSSVTLPATGPYTALGNANALAQWAYCFDRGTADTSRGATNQWNCSVNAAGSLNAADPMWSPIAAKLIPNSAIAATAGGVGEQGHRKTVEAVKWMAANHPEGSYYVPAHLERAGPFNPTGNNGFNVEHLRNLNNAAPRVAFGMETQPGHGAASDRGEYRPRRNNINGVRVDSAGGTTFGGTGVYGAQVGGVWDALLGEGRNFWFFASSDWHNRGAFSVDDRRTDQDFYPGEYQQNFTMVRNGADKLRPQTIVDGLRSGNNFAPSGQLIDRLAFIACVDYPNAKAASRTTSPTESLAVNAATANTDTDVRQCATMGEKLVVAPGANITVAIAVRDPVGKNYSPYSFPNPSLQQIGINQPLDMPVLDHIDVIGGKVTGFRSPADTDKYAGAWPNDWVFNPDMTKVPPAAKNTSAKVIQVFNSSNWRAADGPGFLKMSFRIQGVTESQYVRLRGTNLPALVPHETDKDGNPLRDLETNSAPVSATTANGANGFPENHFLKIPCNTVATNAPANDVVFGGAGIDGCPNHLPMVGGQKFSALDVAAWADLWFYSNPIFIEVKKSVRVAGVQ